MALTRDSGAVPVVGGGLAGIAASLTLAHAGIAVHLFERRAQLGGRVSSFRDPQSGRTVDNGQHVLLGACEALLELLTELGTAPRIRWFDGYRIACPDGARGIRRASLRPFGWLPARARFLPSLLRYSLLTPAERLAVLRGMVTAASLADHELEALDAIPFTEWLQRERQPRRAISRLWEPVVVSALNETLENASARAALWVFRRGFLGRRGDSAFGVPTVPLNTWVGEPALARLHALGVTVERKRDVRAIELGADGSLRLRFDDGEAAARALVLATSFDTYSRLLPPEVLARDPALVSAAAAPPSPIVSAHFFFDRDVALPEGALALVECRAQWIFDRHAATGLDNDRGHLVVVVSAARNLVDLPRESVEAFLLEDLRRAVPGLAGREPRRTLLVTEWNATFRSRPRFEGQRPHVRTAIPGLYVASDVCAVGWPPTMEGAVLAGRRAARALLEDVARLEVRAGASYPGGTHG